MPNPPTKRLTDLDVDEVSLVDRAAVRDADDPTQPMRFYAMKSERRRITMAHDMAPETATVAGMLDKDAAQRRLDDAFDAHLNQYPLQPGEKREVRFAQWTKDDPEGRVLLGNAVAATTAGRLPRAVPAEAQTAINQARQVQKGAEIVIHKAGDAVREDLRKRGIDISPEKARSMARRANPDLARAELGIPMTEES